MILSKLDQVDIVPVEPDVSPDLFQKDVSKSDLVIMSQSTIGERKKEFLGSIKRASKGDGTSCILFVNEGASSDWKDYSSVKNVVIMERPFFPDDLLRLVAKEWGVKI
jgi:hypothetical protein